MKNQDICQNTTVYDLPRGFVDELFLTLIDGGDSDIALMLFLNFSSLQRPTCKRATRTAWEEEENWAYSTKAMIYRNITNEQKWLQKLEEFQKNVQNLKNKSPKLQKSQNFPNLDSTIISLLQEGHFAFLTNLSLDFSSQWNLINDDNPIESLFVHDGVDLLSRLAALKSLQILQISGLSSQNDQNMTQNDQKVHNFAQNLFSHRVTFPSLTSLSLEGNHLTHQDLSIIIQNTSFPGLVELYMGKNDLNCQDGLIMMIQWAENLKLLQKYHFLPQFPFSVPISTSPTPPRPTTNETGFMGWVTIIFGGNDKKTQNQSTKDDNKTQNLSTKNVSTGKNVPTENPLTKDEIITNQPIFHYIARSSILSSLTHLDLVGSHGNTDPQAYIEVFSSPFLRENKILKSVKINIMCSNQSLQVLRSLLQCPSLSNITSFDLDRSEVCQEGFEMICNCPYLTNVKEIGLVNHTWTNQSIKSLVNSKFLSKIEKIQIHYSEIDDTSLTLLSTSPNMSSLKHLDLYQANECTFSGLVAIGSSNYLKKLQKVVLPANIQSADNDTMKRFFTAPNWVTLTSLDLSCSDISHSIAMYFAKSQSFIGLEELNMANTRFIMNGYDNNKENHQNQVRDFFHSLTLPNLSKLNLSNCYLTDEAIEELSTAPGLGNVVTIDIRGNYSPNATKILKRSKILHNLAHIIIEDDPQPSPPDYGFHFGGIRG